MRTFCFVGLFRCSAAAGIVLSVAAGAWANSSVELLIDKVHDESTGFDGYSAEMNINIDPGVTVTNMQASNTGGAIPLDVDVASNQWSAAQNYSTLDALITDMESNYTITVQTSTGTSTMNFTMGNLAGLNAPGTFLGMPVITSPTQGQTIPAAQPTVTWTQPADLARAFVLAAELDSNTVYDQNFNTEVGGTLDLLTSTSWQSSATLDAGPATFWVSYATTDADLVGAVLTNFGTTDAGGVNWGASSFAPSGYPTDGTPLLGLLSSAAVGINAVPEPATFGLLALAGPVLLARRRRER
ncbi:MAG: PEP-CTERM sorting domain-containing protein [Phycisphaerales bacterium]